jgi:hypothetical protein
MQALTILDRRSRSSRQADGQEHRSAADVPRHLASPDQLSPPAQAAL